MSYIELEEFEAVKEQLPQTGRDPLPEDLDLEAISFQLLGAVMSQIVYDKPTTPIFVIGDRARQVVETAWPTLQTFCSATNRKGDYAGWSLPWCFERALSFDLENVECFEDLEEDTSAWFKTVLCDLPEGIESQASRYGRDLLVLHDIETASAFDAFVTKRDLTRQNFVICTSRTLVPSLAFAIVVAT
jgi:hypothetical protein